MVHQLPATTRSGGSPPPASSPTTPARVSTLRRGSPPGPDGALWFTNSRLQLDRAHHHRRSRHQLHRHRHQRPEGITTGPDGALWFTNCCNGSIGRITTAGVVTNYTGPGIDHRPGSRPDPTAPLVHESATTRSGASPPGGVTNYTGTGIDEPTGITAVPDDALWFTNQTCPPHLDRPHHHRRGRDELHGHRHRHTPGGSSPPAPTAPCGSRTFPPTTRSAASPPCPM